MSRTPARRAIAAPDRDRRPWSSLRKAITPRVRALVATFTAGGEAAAIQRNVGWLMADRIGRLAVGTVLNVWMIRSLGPDRLGLFGFAQSVVGIFAVLSQLGLETIVVRDLVRRPDQSREILGSALGLRLAGALL